MLLGAMMVSTAGLSPGCLGAITLGAPWVAWGLLAGLVPIVIHLVFRQRPRRQVFPAMRFLLASHSAATRAHRLKHLLLLMCRILLIGLMVGSLSKLTSSAGDESAAARLGAGSAPAISAAIALDDSASMGYRYQGQTRLQWAIAWARNLVEDSVRFGDGSQFAVVTGSSGSQEAAWTADRRAVSREIGALRLANHDRPMGALLRSAYQLLATARCEQREVYLFTDLTAQSWRKPLPEVPASLSGLFILDVGQDENRNVALSWLQVPDRVLPAGLPVVIPVLVRTGDLPSDAVMEFSVDGQPRGRQPVGPMGPNSEAEVALAVPAMTQGTHALTVTLQPEDALACDNRRFAVVSVGQVPQVTLVRDTAGGEVATLVASMLAPATLPEPQRPYVIRPVSPDELATVELGPALAVIFADVAAPNEQAWAQADRYVRAGGALIIVPGSNLSPEQYVAGQALLPAAIQAVVDCPAPMALAAAALEHPYLRPFADAGSDSINDRQAFKRLELGPVGPQATVVVPFADHKPALIERPVGRGRVILLAFSPAGRWGQFGTQAGPMIVLLHTILESLAPRARDVESLSAGSVVRRSSRSLGGPPLFIAGPDAANLGAAHAEPLPVEVENDQVTLPTEPPGAWCVLREGGVAATAPSPDAAQAEATGPAGAEVLGAGRPGRVVLHYSANVAEAESDLSRLDRAAVRGSFREGLAVVAGPADRLPQAGRRGRPGIEWLVPLALAGLCLLVVETLFANRFYGPPRDSRAVV